MCMKFINATTSCYKSVSVTDNNITSMDFPFDHIIAEVKKKNISIDRFYVVTHLNFLGTNKDEDKSYSVLEKEGRIKVTIRLTKCSLEENNRRYKDLDSFEIDFSNEETKKNIQKACFKYLNYKRVTEVEPLSLPMGEGPYVIKVLLQEPDGEETVQTMNNFFVSKSNN